MKQCVSWYGNDGTRRVWRRAGEVAFSLVETTPNASRRNSIVSICSGISSVGNSVGSVEMTADVYRHIRPELQDGGRNPTEKMASSSLSPADGSTSSPPEGVFQETESLSLDDLLDNFQSHLIKYPSLLRRVLDWGISRIPNCRVGEAEVSKFG